MQKIILKVNNILRFFQNYFRALDKNEYNHITATYYLLAERKLNLATSKKSKINKKYFYNILPISLQVCIYYKYFFQRYECSSGKSGQLYTK